jgi:hypothetical protein
VVLMKCVPKEDGYDILREIHEGVCGNHAASRTLVGKAYRAGFWWPCPGSQSHHHTAILAVCLLEPRYDWALHNGARRLHPCLGDY